MAAGNITSVSKVVAVFPETEETGSQIKKGSGNTPGSISAATTPRLLNLDFDLLFIRAFRLGELYLEKTFLEGGSNVLRIHEGR